MDPADEPRDDRGRVCLDLSNGKRPRHAGHRDLRRQKRGGFQQIDAGEPPGPSAHLIAHQGRGRGRPRSAILNSIQDARIHNSRRYARDTTRKVQKRTQATNALRLLATLRLNEPTSGSRHATHTTLLGRSCQLANGGPPDVTCSLGRRRSTCALGGIRHKTPDTKRDKQLEPGLNATKLVTRPPKRPTRRGTRLNTRRSTGYVP